MSRVTGFGCIGALKMEDRGFEPLTYRLRTYRSTN